MDESLKENLIKKAGDYAGATIGSLATTALGTVVAGPVGAVGGAFLGSAIDHAFTKIGEEVSKRALGPSENKRVGTALEGAKLIVSKRMDNGDELRTDGFLESGSGDRAASEELLEGFLLSAQKEYEEKKIPYLSRLYANALFSPEISRPTMNRLLKIADQLTYRQLVILHVLVEMLSARPDLLKQESYRSVSGAENVVIASEVYELYRMSLIGSSDAILDAAGINPSSLSVVGFGAHLFNLMELSRMEPDEELRSISVPIESFLAGEKPDSRFDVDDTAGRSGCSIDTFRSGDHAQTWSNL